MYQTPYTTGQQREEVYRDGQTVTFSGQVIRATYNPQGHPGHDVTAQVQGLIRAGRTTVIGGIHTAIGDPFPGAPKMFTVWYATTGVVAPPVMVPRGVPVNYGVPTSSVPPTTGFLPPHQAPGSWTAPPQPPLQQVPTMHTGACREESYLDGQTVSFSGQVVRATYNPRGHPGHDVTAQVQSLVNAGRTTIVGGIHTAIGDPFPGVPKVFKVWYAPKAVVATAVVEQQTVPHATKSIDEGTPQATTPPLTVEADKFLKQCGPALKSLSYAALMQLRNAASAVDIVAASDAVCFLDSVGSILDSDEKQRAEALVDELRSAVLDCIQDFCQRIKERDADALNAKILSRLYEQAQSLTVTAKKRLLGDGTLSQLEDAHAQVQEFIRTATDVDAIKSMLTKAEYDDLCKNAAVLRKLGTTFPAAEFPVAAVEEHANQLSKQLQAVIGNHYVTAETTGAKQLEKKADGTQNPAGDKQSQNEGNRTCSHNGVAATDVVKLTDAQEQIFDALSRLAACFPSIRSTHEKVLECVNRMTPVARQAQEAKAESNDIPPTKPAGADHTAATIKSVPPAMPAVAATQTTVAATVGASPEALEAAKRGASTDVASTAAADKQPRAGVATATTHVPTKAADAAPGTTADLSLPKPTTTTMDFETLSRQFAAFKEQTMRAFEMQEAARKAQEQRLAELEEEHDRLVDAVVALRRTSTEQQQMIAELRQERERTGTRPSAGEGPTVWATRTGRKYHREGCYGASIKMSLAQATLQGLDACSVCGGY